MLEIATVPVTARAFDPIVAPLMAMEFAVAAPSAGVVKLGDVESTIDPVPVTLFESVTPPYVNAADIVVARVKVIAPVDVPPRVIVPVPLASIVRFSAEPVEITLRATPPPAAALLMLMPVAAEAVEASTLNDGFVVPEGPTASAFAPADVIARPAAARVANVVAPLFPPLKAKASVVPTPVVVWNDS